MNNQVLSEILAFGALFIAGQGIAILLQLFTIKKKNTAFYLLATYIALNCCLFILQYFMYRQIPFPSIVLRFAMLYILKGGLLYLYVKALMTPHFRLQWQHSIHLLPLVFIIIMDQLFISGKVQLGGYIRLFPIYAYLIYGFTLVAYCVAAARLMPDYRQYIRRYFSSVDRINLEWLYKLVIVYLISSLIFLALGVTTFFEVSNDPNVEFFYHDNIFVFFICFYLIASGGYRQELTGIDISVETEVDNKDAETKTDKPLLIDEEAGKALWHKLNTYMQGKEPFLDEELKLSQLAAGIDVCPRHLSQVLNLFANQSFYDYVNGYRAEKARQLIEGGTQPEMPMVDIGIEAGFANKVTFYKYFKKHFLKTPLQYRKVFNNKATS